MHIVYFTERPYRWLPEAEVLRNKGFFGISNARFDHVRAADDYNAYLDEYVLAEELGFDGLALNEHHGNPFCMGSVMNIETAALARITHRAKLIQIGTPLPVVKHPLRTAEELAEIDLISRGRLVAGIVRGAGSEQFFNNANPAYNREMFEEAHDFIIEAWTRQGPWRYEGKHFHYRHVNPWALPYQKPHPPIVVPGVLSPETVRWCAARNYPYFGLGTALGPTTELWDMYADAAAHHGFQAGPENFGYVVPAFVADDEATAQELGAGFVFGGGQAGFSRTEHALPPGYNSKDAIRRLAKTPGGTWLGVSREKLLQHTAPAGADDRPVDGGDVEAARTKLRAAYQRSQANHQILVGTPAQVLAKAKVIVEVLRPGTLILFSTQGPVGDEARRRNIELLATEVLPPLREFADRLGLVDPFTRRPGERKLHPGQAREPVVDRGPLEALGLR